MLGRHEAYRCVTIWANPHVPGRSVFNDQVGYTSHMRSPFEQLLVSMETEQQELCSHSSAAREGEKWKRGPGDRQGRLHQHFTCWDVCCLSAGRVWQGGSVAGSALGFPATF